MRLLVTGASGFIGGALAFRRLSDGTDVRALVHATKSVGLMKDAGAEIFEYYISNPSSCARAGEGAGVVFH